MQHPKRKYALVRHKFSPQSIHFQCLILINQNNEGCQVYFLGHAIIKKIKQKFIEILQYQVRYVKIKAFQ